jgi:quinol monooxygenase YgiN
MVSPPPERIKKAQAGDYAVLDYLARRITVLCTPEAAGGRSADMPDPIVYIDSSTVREGRIEALKTAMTELADFVEANEPGLIAYNAYLNADGTRMTVIHVHRDSASLEFHMKVAGPLFPRFADLVELITIDLYGGPSDTVVQQMRDKARMLGSGTVEVHGLHAGFARLTSSTAPTPSP